jgi:hypothetical protein
VFAAFSPHPQIRRTQNTTIVEGSIPNGRLQKFGIDSLGAVGTVKSVCIRDEKGLTFLPEEFCADLICFLAFAGYYYDKIKFYGDCQLTATVLIPEAHALRPGKFNGRLLTGSLFEPEIPVFRAGFSTEVHIPLHPDFYQRIPEYTEPVLTDLSRVCGSILTSSFSTFASACLSETLTRFNHSLARLAVKGQSGTR